MQEKKQNQSERDSGAISEKNEGSTDKYRELSNHQKQGQQESKEGESERGSLNEGNNSAIPMDNDDTLGVP